MRSPFKFLDAYTQEDKDVFFGRDQETEMLFKMSSSSPITLVYGQAGTGKTSLINCGLASRIDQTDWMPLLIRRQDDINRSLKEAIERITDEPIDRITTALENLFIEFLRPPYLIFDQFEEVFILGSASEQDQLIQTISEILASRLRVNIIIIIREEYLAHLSSFEQKIPKLFDNRLRVEPMSMRQSREVILKSFEAFNVQLVDPEESVHLILDNITDGRSQLNLPTLQVYLDRLYKASYEKTYLSGQESLVPLEITQSDIMNIGGIGNVLSGYLDEQLAIIQQELSQNEELGSDEVVRKVLDNFVSLEGTSSPQSRESLERFRTMELPYLSAENLEFILNRLEETRILRMTEETFELSQSNLAQLIAERRTEEEVISLQSLRRVQHFYKEYQLTGEYLSKNQLASLEPFIQNLTLPNDEVLFIQESRKLISKKSKRRKLIGSYFPWIIVGILLVVIIFLLSVQ